MAKYAGFQYKGSYYGEIPRLPFSVEPFQATAVDYDKVLLTWGPPQGAINGLRLVRNQDGFGEWPEDGIVLFDKSSDDGNFGDNEYVDGVDNFDDTDGLNNIPLVPGKFTYYRMWVRRTATNLWTVADDVVVILPKKHGTVTPDNQELISTHDNFVDLLPRVYTSASQNPLDAVDTGSDLYNFLKAFSFTLDEMLTLADLLKPDYSGRSTNPATLGLQVAEYGITPASDDILLRQKKMVREAIYMYSRKGTKLALSTLVESLTGFDPTITDSPNLILSNQDSTFYIPEWKDYNALTSTQADPVGSWKVVGDCSLKVETTVLPPSGEDNQIDNDYSAVIDINTVPASITNGKESAVHLGIPVTAGTSYSFSYYAQSKISGELVTVQPVINWHDSAGNLLSSHTGTAAPTTISWSKYSTTATAPGTSSSVASYSVTSNVVTITTSAAHNISPGSVVNVTGLGAPYDGKVTVLAPSTTTLTYTLTGTNADVPSTLVTATVSAIAAVYASLELKFSTVGIVYVDMLQFALSSVTNYYEARGVQIFLGPSKSNFIKNPSFSGITQGWTITGSGTSVTYPAGTAPYLYKGDSMLQAVTALSGATSISADTGLGGKPTGKFYTFSVYAQIPTGTSNVYLSMTAVDSVNPSLTKASTPVAVGAEWTRLSVTMYLPSTFVKESLYFTTAIKIDSSNNTTLNLEAAQLETAFVPTLYIDGSFPAEYGVVWEGLTNSSPSHLYSNRQAKNIRLIQELERFLPRNTPYVVSNFGGVQTKGITL